MPERVTGPYRGYYISATANLTPAPEGDEAGQNYVGSVSIGREGPDDVRQFQVMVDLGNERRFSSELDALAQVEADARLYIDRLLAAA